jgi:hypothetical protein
VLSFLALVLALDVTAEPGRVLDVAGPWSQDLGELALVAVYVINGLMPYLGPKFDGSLAMFSGLRPDRWDHLLIRAPRRWLEPRYATDVVFTARDEFGQERRIWSDLVSRSAHDAFTVGYLAEVCRALERQGAGSVMASGRGLGNSGKIVVGGPHGLAPKWNERLSVYPYRLPGLGQPLCM